MSYKARQVTNEQGYIRHHNYRASDIPLYAERQIDYEAPRSTQYVGGLDELRYGKYALLAEYIMNKYKVYHEMVRFGSNGLVKWIELDGKTFWCRKQIVHDRYK